jgi:steroid delta-isomerase-like uncharacterized protein
MLAVDPRYNDEVAEGGDLAPADELFTADDVDHAHTSPEIHGREGLRQMLGAIRAGVPDLRFALEERLLARDARVARWTLRTTHRGELLGLPATGWLVAVAGVSIHRSDDGRIRERWDDFDALGLQQQVGAIPAAGAAGAQWPAAAAGAAAPAPLSGRGRRGRCRPRGASDAAAGRPRARGRSPSGSSRGPSPASSRGWAHGARCG